MRDTLPPSLLKVWPIIWMALFILIRVPKKILVLHGVVDQKKGWIDKNCIDLKQSSQLLVLRGKLPGLVVNVKDLQSEPWSSDVGSIPGFT